MPSYCGQICKKGGAHRAQWRVGGMRKIHAGIPRVALTPSEAAASLGVGLDFFDEHVAPELRLIRRGRKRLVSVRELERWASESAESTLEEP